MRQGRVYKQYMDRLPAHDMENGELRLRVPLELDHELRQYAYVDWTDNGDGTYTLTPTKNP